MSRRLAFVLPALASTLAALSLACARPPAPTPATVASEPAATDVRHCPPCQSPPSAAVEPPPADPGAHDMARVLREANTPPELAERGAAAHVWDDHVIDHSINPFYLRGDFDGDDRPDYLVGVLRKDAPPGPSSPRLVVLRGTTGERAAIWLDDAEGLSLPARDGWYVHDERTKVPVGFDGTKPPRLVGDAFVMMKAESSSALIHWTGTRFASHWLSD